MKTFKEFKVIVVDQSDIKEKDSNIFNLVKELNGKYLKSNLKGKSRGLNEALKFCSSEIIAFTDDDCLPDKNWAKTIYKTFSDLPQVAGIFGRTLPHDPKRHKKLICVCTFLKKRPRFINKPVFHAEGLGFGNNMAFKSSVFKQIGGFKEWLGPGSIGSNAEDADFSMRVLLNNKIIYFTPKMTVFHNRWLTSNEFKNQQLSYICGEFACYGYFALQGKKFAYRILKKSLKRIFTNISELFNSLKNLQPDSYLLFLDLIIKIIYIIRGISVALFFTLKKLKHA